MWWWWKARHAASSPGIWSPVIFARAPRMRWYWGRAATAMPSTCRQRQTLNVTATWRAHKRGAAFGQPLLHPDSPHLHPGVGGSSTKLTLIGVAANDGRVWVPKKKGDTAPPRKIPKTARLLFGASLPQLWQSGAPDVASRNAKHMCDEGHGVGPGKLGVYLDLPSPSSGWGKRRWPRATATFLRCMRRSPARIL